MRKILVLRGGALGDFIVTLPALALLKRQWPESRVELVGNALAAEIGRRDGLIDTVHSQHEARWSALYGTEKLARGFGEWLSEFDLVLNFWPDPDGEIAGRFPIRSGQIYRTQTALPTRGPAAAHYCEPLRTLGLEPGEYFHQLKAVPRNAPDLARRTIAIHPGSGSPRKNWPIARWRELSAWLRGELNAQLLFVIGAAEKDSGASEACGSLGDVAEGLSVTELASRLAACRLFLGHDSGVSHLAAACGVPCILLFGPTDPAVWSPPAPEVQVLRKGMTPESISVSDVEAAVTAVLSARK